MELNALSHVHIAYDPHRRRIELKEGEALFHVAKDAQRPFEVATPNAVVRAIGTTFNVYHRRADTRVAVVDGRVQVLGQTQAVALGANEAADVEARGHVVRETPVAPQKATAWTQRRLIFEETPLVRVVQEFNLYNTSQLSIDAVSEHAVFGDNHAALLGSLRPAAGGAGKLDPAELRKQRIWASGSTARAAKLDSVARGILWT